MRASSEEVKEVYARFGLAYYHAEVLHRGLCNLHALSRIPERGGMTGPRLAELLSEAYSSTLGRIVNLVLPILPEALVAKLQDAIARRNFLAHHFWFERIHLTTTSEGTRQLVAELTAYSKVFQELDGEIEKCTESYQGRAGITDERLREALEATLRGEDSGPLIQQRRLRKEEFVVGVYEAPIDGGGSTLVFQTKDGELWQLCDAGLGWTAYDQVAADWRPAEPLQDGLPAHINPRPLVKAPWSYEISFARGVSLIVCPGAGSNQFRWGIRRTGA